MTLFSPLQPIGFEDADAGLAAARRVEHRPSDPFAGHRLVFPQRTEESEAESTGDGSGGALPEAEFPALPQQQRRPHNRQRSQSDAGERLF